MKFIPVAKPCIGTLEAKEVYKTLKSNWITMGQKVAKFENDVAKFNNHYENEIINIKNNIFEKISELLKEYASLNGIELIIEKNQYLIAADKININQVIFEKLNASKMELKFTKYEN